MPASPFGNGKENRTAIQEMVTAYNLMLSSTVEQCEPILTSLAK